MGNDSFLSLFMIILVILLALNGALLSGAIEIVYNAIIELHDQNLYNYNKLLNTKTIEWFGFFLF